MKTTAVSSASEEELFSEYKKDRSEKMRDEIFEKYSYICAFAARHYSNRGIDYDDLYQVASIGLILAIDRFDTEKGVKFSTYALPTVSGEIKKYFRDKGNFIRIPRKLYEVFSKAEKLHLSGMGAGSYKIVSLDAELENESGTLSNTLGFEDENFLLAEDKHFVEECLESFTKQERAFIVKRFYEEKSQRTIAGEMDISQMQVSRMERRLLKMMKNMYFHD